MKSFIVAFAMEVNTIVPSGHGILAGRGPMARGYSSWCHNASPLMVLTFRRNVRSSMSSKWWSTRSKTAIFFYKFESLSFYY